MLFKIRFAYYCLKSAFYRRVLGKSCNDDMNFVLREILKRPTYVRVK